MVLMFNFTNPLWQFLIGPLSMFGLGWAARAAVDRICDRLEHEEEPFTPISHVRLLPGRPFDQEID